MIWMRKKRRRQKRLQIKLNSPSLLITLCLILGFGSGYLTRDLEEAVVLRSSNPNPNLSVCFSPKGRCEKLILKEIESAKKEVLVQSYAFTSLPIAKALISAHKKGVKVKVLRDESQAKAPYSQIGFLKKNGVNVSIDHTEGLAHNKIMIIDEERVLTGSYNFTKSANTRNAENLILIHDKKMAEIFKLNWKVRQNPGRHF